jgi:hypothetical protein
VGRPAAQHRLQLDFAVEAQIAVIAGSAGRDLETLACLEAVPDRPRQRNAVDARKERSARHAKGDRAIVHLQRQSAERQLDPGGAATTDQRPRLPERVAVHRP